MQNGDGPKVPLQIPILGAPQSLGKGKGSGPIAGIARRLAEDGTFEVDLMRGPNGQPVASAPRAAYMDAEELIEVLSDRFRAIVREELAALKE